MVCGNAYYISLNKDAESISSVDIPRIVVSTENYKIAECEMIDNSPLVIDNLWVAFATSDSSTTKHSDFYEVQGAEAENVTSYDVNGDVVEFNKWNNDIIQVTQNLIKPSI